MPEEYRGRDVWEDLDGRTSKEFIYLNLAGILNLIKGSFKENLSLPGHLSEAWCEQEFRVTWRIPFGGTCDHRTHEAVG